MPRGKKEDFGLLDRPQRSHRASKTGKKAQKKKLADKKRRGLSTDRHNAKAFLPSGGVSSLRRSARNLDLEQKKLHAPLVDRSDPNSLPPYVVAIVGPPKVGKSTLLASLVKHYTKFNATDISGPITVVSGMSRQAKSRHPARLFCHCVR